MVEKEGLDRLYVRRGILFPLLYFLQDFFRLYYRRCVLALVALLVEGEEITCGIRFVF